MLLYDRARLSQMNNWLDENGRILEQCTPILVDGENKREKTAKENMSYFKKIFDDKES